MKINQAGIEMIKSFEGLKLHSYQDGGGVWTIGYGHTGPNVVKGLEWFVSTADMMLRVDIARFEEFLIKWLADYKVTLNDNEFSALIAFIFNIGCGAFNKSTMAKLIYNKSPKADIAKQFIRWNKDNGKVVPGLTRRREAEAVLFLKAP